MCGIVGYVGNKAPAPILIDGLKRLEYRGYDSAGICTIRGSRAEIVRCEGKLVNLERLLAENCPEGTVGIGHTRWATHGRPTENNAHPHQAGPVVVVHNGIIENFGSLKKSLHDLGHTFRSETDTEVIAHLIEQQMKLGVGFEEAVRITLRELKGAYALCIVCETAPDTLIAAKNGSPMVVGLGRGEFLVASDIPAILAHTREMVFMDDGEVAVFKGATAAFTTLAGRPLRKDPRHIEWSPLMAEKGGYQHFMLKEIFEQPRVVRDALAGRLLEEEGDAYLKDLGLTTAELRGFSRVCIVACGSSWHAALVGKYLIEGHCRIPVEVEIASEFRYRQPVVGPDTLLIAVSQSGETADTLAALREGQDKGARTIAICNVIDSSIPREADGVIYTHAGPEISVASTKAFVAQLVSLLLFTLRLGRAIGAISCQEGQEFVARLRSLPPLLKDVLQLDPLIEAVARRFHAVGGFLYLARGINYPLAFEGALKMKEISYIHAEGYPAGEMKHGPIALIDEQMPVVVLAPCDTHYDKVISNIEEVRARGGKIIALCTVGDSELHLKAESVLEIPVVPTYLNPLLFSVPLQLLAYHVAVMRGNDVDQPRNLAKSVTVE
jgi:glucosamine--fructose-6-phosphate aminotransferase (isomerizing)